MCRFMRELAWLASLAIVETAIIRRPLIGSPIGVLKGIYIYIYIYLLRPVHKRAAPSPQACRRFSLTKLCFEGFLLFRLMCRLHGVAPPGSPGRGSLVPPASPCKFPKPKCPRCRNLKGPNNLKFAPRTNSVFVGFVAFEF